MQNIEELGIVFKKLDVLGIHQVSIWTALIGGGPYKGRYPATEKGREASK